MFRKFIVGSITAAAACLSAWAQVSGPGSARPEPIRASPASPEPAISTVYYAQDAGAITSLEENTQVSARMVNALVMAVTGKPSVAQAWRSLIGPKERVGIKIAGVGGHYFSTRAGVVEAIIAGLKQAGFSSAQITVWDREIDEANELRAHSRRGEYALRTIRPIAGYDRGAELVAPILGRLIWGDLLFKPGKVEPFKPRPSDADQLSASSYLATILSRDVTKVINVPVLCDEGGCGVAGALYNMTVPNVDNWRRFVQADGSGNDSIPELYADERIGPKVVLQVLDGLIGQYAGGPAPNPNYAFAFNTIYASRDPVAVDATALRKIEQWRKQAQLPPIGRRGNWLESASQLGLGQCEEAKIELKPVTAAQ